MALEDVLRANKQVGAPLALGWQVPSADDARAGALARAARAREAVGRRPRGRGCAAHLAARAAAAPPGAPTRVRGACGRRRALRGRLATPPRGRRPPARAAGRNGPVIAREGTPRFIAPSALLPQTHPPCSMLRRSTGPCLWVSKRRCARRPLYARAARALGPPARTHTRAPPAAGAARQPAPALTPPPLAGAPVQPRAQLSVVTHMGSQLVSISPAFTHPPTPLARARPKRCGVQTRPQLSVACAWTHG